jgi:hypothetical protein
VRRPASTSVRLPPWQPWAALALFSGLTHFAWEMLQAPFYQGMAAAPHWPVVRICALASAGDVLLGLAAYAVVAAALRDRAWLFDPRGARIAGYLGVGLAITVALEALNVDVLRRWSYSPSMPRVFGIGLAPLLQWIVVPLVVLWLARRHQVPGAALNP